MTLIIPLRSNNAYIGLAKQTVSGTAVAPTTFPRWLDGTNIQIELKSEEIRESDTSRRLSQVIKNGQSVKLKLSCSPRPIELGLFESFRRRNDHLVESTELNGLLSQEQKSDGVAKELLFLG